MLRDYDGHFLQWNEYALVPDPIRQFCDFVARHANGRPLVVPRAHLVAAVLSEHHKVTLVDRQLPIANGDYEYVKADPEDDAFFNLLDHDTVLVNRRALQKHYAPEWIARLHGTLCDTMLIECFTDEVVSTVPNSKIENLFWKKRGWNTSGFGGKAAHLVVATRSLDSDGDLDSETVK